MQQSNQFTSYTVSLGAAQNNFSQSLSGSETDVSTSNENLSNEEKYVIRHTPRQEPQGQENLPANNNSNRNSLRDSLPSNRSSLDVSSSSYNTLIIHGATGDESWTGRNSGQNSSLSFVHPTTSNLFNEIKLVPKQKRSSISPSSSTASTGVQEITDIPEDCLSQLSVLKQLAKEVKVPSSSLEQSNKNTIRTDNVPDLISKFDKVSFNKHNASPLSDYSTQWLNKSPLQAAVNSRNKINNEKLTLSKSQPDLTSVGLVSETGIAGFKRGVSAPRPPTKGREEEHDSKREIWPSAEMVEILIKENSALKHELENCYQRVEKTNKLEQEIFKVHRAHEDLVQSCNRREQLERAARARLQADCRQYQDLNRTLKEQRDLLSNQILSGSPDRSDVLDSLKKELIKREGLIKTLYAQCKELAASKERQEIEMAAQRATLQEQRTHIDILDTALTNAQANVVRLEEENRKKQLYVERVAQLQNALYSLQLASDRREETERKLRLQLEKELQRTKIAQGNFWERKTGWDSSSNTSESDCVSELKRQLREKDENIMKLEGECAKWEQRYLEENSLRQAAIDAASIPKDAKIAALEKTSQETEKIIAEARNEKIRHMDEVHAAQKRVADLESRMIDLESKLAQRDAMIHVLEKHTYEKDVSVSVLGRSPHHTPHASLAGTEIDLGLVPTVSREELVSSVLTNSTTYGSTDSSSYHMKSYSNKNFDANPSLDSHLDIQLLSKRALCCFPGLTNPITGQRKDKIPKPLLVNVTGASSSSERQSPFKPSENASFYASRHSNENGPEMILLEKQGRTSQKQRMTENTSRDIVQDVTNRNICPSPSSLPRPPRSSSSVSSSHHRSGLPRRMGDYNRLDSNHNDSVPQRKNSNGADSLSSNTSSRHTSPARSSSLIPSPRKFGEYGRLSESAASSASLRKSSSSRIRSGTGGGGGRSNGERDSVSTLSDNSASSLPTPSKVKLYGGGGGISTLRRRNSLGRETKSSSENGKYRIQF